MDTGEDWARLASYVTGARMAAGFGSRDAFAEATGVTSRTLGNLERGQRVSPPTLAAIEPHCGWKPGSCAKILAGGEPDLVPLDPYSALDDDDKGIVDSLIETLHARRRAIAAREHPGGPDFRTGREVPGAGPGDYLRPGH